MGWLDCREDAQPSPQMWKAFAEIMERVKAHLVSLNILMWEDVYDRIFDRVLSRVISNPGGEWSFDCHIPILMKEDALASVRPTREFQVSRNRWRNLKAPVREDLRVDLHEVLCESTEACLLTPLEGYILVCRFVYGHTLTAIGELLEYPSESMTEVVNSIVEKFVNVTGNQIEVYTTVERPLQFTPRAINFDPRFTPGNRRRLR